jgi:DNA-binding beta-propeller fold protein YncE
MSVRRPLFQQRALRRGFTAIMLMLAAACQTPFGASDSGRILVNVRWPGATARFRLQLIPADTTRIDLVVRGAGIPDDAPIRARLMPKGSTAETALLDVPIGPKLLFASAYNDAEQLVASGQVSLQVSPHAWTEARLVLQPPRGNPSPEASMDPQPSLLPTPVASVGPATESNWLIDTVAGDGLRGAIDANDALAARFHTPRNLAYDVSRQVLYIADTANYLIRRLDLANGAVSTIAGRVPRLGPGGVPQLNENEFGQPAGMAVGPDGSVYFADRERHAIRRLKPNGVLETFAGRGLSGYQDGPAAQALFHHPVDVVLDAQGTLYVADQFNHRVRRIRDGQVDTLAGSGPAGIAVQAGTIPGEPALNRPCALLLAPNGQYLVVAEPGAHKVSRIDVGTGIITPLAGTGQANLSGEGGPALNAGIPLPVALTWLPDGALLIADGWAFPMPGDSLLGAASRLLKLTPDGLLVRIAGQGPGQSAYGFGGDGRPATEALLNNPGGLTADAQGRIYVADTYNNRIRVLSPTRPTLIPGATPTSLTPAATPTPDSRTTPPPPGAGVPSPVTPSDASGLTRALDND